MSLNLLSMLQDQLGDTLVDQASGFLGESKEGTGKAISAILPSIMGAFTSKGASESGAGAILDAIKGGGYDGSMLSNLGGLFGGGNKTTGLLNSGSNILNMLLGNKMGGLLDVVMNFSGLKRSSSSSLMSMVAPLVMNMIGKQVFGGSGMGVSGLMDLLKGQKDHVAAAMPAGFDADPGLFGFAKDAFSKVTGVAGDAVGGTMDAGKKVVGGAADLAGDAVSGTVDAGKKVVSGAADVAGNVVGGAADLAGGAVNTVTEKSGGILKWVLMGLLGLLALGFAAKQGCNTGVDVLDDAAAAVTETTGDVVGGAADMAKKGADAVGDAAGAAADMAGDAAGAVADGVGAVAGLAGDALSGAFGAVNDAAKAALDKVTFAAGSAGSQVMDFINGGFKGDNRFTFKGLTFNTGSAVITAASAAEVDNLAAILKAYPDVKMIIEGYTDNTGDAAANLQLSKDRAEAVKARLGNQGIDGDRIQTEGYGDANPVGDNATAEGRAANRRIEARII